MKAITLRLPDQLYEVVRQAAFDRRMSMNTVMVEAIRYRYHLIMAPAVKTEQGRG